MDLDYIAQGFTVRVWNRQDWRQHKVSGPCLHFWAVLTSVWMSDVSACARYLLASHHTRAQLHLLNGFLSMLEMLLGASKAIPLTDEPAVAPQPLLSGQGLQPHCLSSLPWTCSNFVSVFPAFRAVFQVCWWAQSRGVTLPLALMAVSCLCCPCTASPHSCLGACLAPVQFAAHQCPWLSPGADAHPFWCQPVCCQVQDCELVVVEFQDVPAGLFPCVPSLLSECVHK